MEFAEKQLIIMQPEEVQTSRTWLKVTQDKRHDFPSNENVVKREILLIYTNESLRI